MFKKPVEAKLSQRLSGADKKKLRRTLKDRFPLASDANIDEILPPKAEISVAKYSNKVHVYVIEGGLPMLFDIDGRSTEIYPTVYALWKVPELLPSFLLKGGEVSRYVIGGADLMFPGISIPPEGLLSFLAGQPWAVKVPGNPAPIAPSDVHSDASNDEDDINVVESGPIATNIQGSTYVDASKNLDAGAQTHEEMTADISGLKFSDNVTAEVQSDEKEQQTFSGEEIDALLDKCLLQALHTTVKDKDLPMPGSTLWSNHILPCRPAGITLDIKKSSYKKLSKWLQSKSSAGLMSTKEDRYKKEVMLLGVNRGHSDYMSFKPEKRAQESAEQRHDNSVGEGSQMKLQLQVVEVYKPSTHVNSIFTTLGADTGSFYSASDASDIVFRYVEKENLVKPTDKAVVVLDVTLCDALYKGSVKKGSAYPTEIHKKDLGSTFLSRMQVHHRVSKGNEVAVRKGAARPIQIMTERRQGNKKVTRVSGLETFLLDVDSLAMELQKKFACSTSVAELPGKKGQHEVLVQGGVIDDLAKHLVDHYGVPKRYIEVLDKTKK
ncbi:Translation initiation factor SUI1 [Musa troglodytarum]|uniref:Translation initiation factor SUI1 n=1 Tax=Musa troglodytarum TaxID=320322 RepID=A0A9E7EGV7_9LILI|nr:Translation initiation factor SUI1 [Musa troglodytarum]